MREPHKCYCSFLVDCWIILWTYKVDNLSSTFPGTYISPVVEFLCSFYGDSKVNAIRLQETGFSSNSACMEEQTRTNIDIPLCWQGPLFPWLLSDDCFLIIFRDCPITLEVKEKLRIPSCPWLEALIKIISGYVYDISRLAFKF